MATKRHEKIRKGERGKLKGSLERGAEARSRACGCNGLSALEVIRVASARGEGPRLRSGRAVGAEGEPDQMADDESFSKIW